MEHTFRIFIPITNDSALRKTIFPLVEERIGKPPHSPYVENLVKNNTRDLMTDLRLGSDVVVFNRDGRYFLGFAIISNSRFLDSNLQPLLRTIFEDLKYRGLLGKIDGEYGIIVEDLKKKQPFFWDRIITELDPIYGGKRKTSKKKINRKF
jgi:hypothetical protein